MALVPGLTTHHGRGVVRSGPNTVRAGWICSETWRCYSLAPALVDLTRCIYAFAIRRTATCKLLNASR